ncbi:MAG: YbhB/YbcL family Raf kinase inhibitor-like protein [Minisyncoccia bacterium]
MKRFYILIIFLIIIFIILIGFKISKKTIRYQKTPIQEITSTKLTEEKKMKIESPAFENNKEIPSKYTCDGEDINPPLKFSDIPEDAKSLVLIVDDPDAPFGIFTHWIVWNIDPKTTFIEENSVPEGAIVGRNDFGRNSYGGPCPPSGTHHYYFKIYALDTTLNLDKNSSKKDLEKAMKNHILEKGELVGIYKRK